MRIIFTIILFFKLSTAVAQVDTSVLYTDANLKEVQPQQAKFIFKAYQKDSTSWVFLKYNQDHMLLLKETYADPDLQIRHGMSIEYKDGKPYRKGIFINNKKEGNFVTYDTTGIATEIQFYKLDSLSGSSYALWPNGTTMQERIYGAKEKIIQRSLYYPNGKLAIKETFSATEGVIEGVYLDSLGNRVIKSAIESPPIFPGGIDKFYQFLARNIKYPQQAYTNNIQGNVYVSFVITQDGALEDVKIDRKLHSSLDEEAIRVVRLSPNWNPGVMFGKPVRVRYHIPIKFSLSNNR